MTKRCREIRIEILTVWVESSPAQNKAPEALIHFSDAFELMSALFWDRRRPRLHSSRLTDLSGNVGRRGRLRSQKSALISLKASLKGICYGCKAFSTRERFFRLNVPFCRNPTNSPFFPTTANEPMPFRFINSRA